MKAQAKLYGPVHESFVLSHMRAANAQMSLHIRRLCCLNWKKKKRCRWRFRPNFVPSKAVVLLLLIHSLMSPLVCRGAVFGPRFAMHYLMFFLVLQSSQREHNVLLFCLSTISVLWLFLTVPWIGLKYVIVIIPDHTCLRFNGSVHQSLILVA